MDPVTVVGFLAAVVQLIDVTSKVIYYFNRLKDAPKVQAKLVRECTHLLLLFTDLRCLVDNISTSTDPWFTSLQALGGKEGPLMEFKCAMEDIADKLVPATSVVNISRVVLRWTLDKKEIDNILSRIERLKTLISLALQKDHFNSKLSLALKEEVTVGFQEMKANRDVEKINRWLAAPLPSSNHNTAMKRRQSRTGEWFLQSKEFEDWKTGTNSFIWLHGIPGCGKTILYSTITEHVMSQFQSDPTISIAYFYFDFNDSDKPGTEKLIRSLIVQLLAQSSDLPEPLLSAFSRSQSGQKQPTLTDMRDILRHMLDRFDTTYILLDALDECTDPEELLDFIEALMNWNVHNLHLLATSRKENDIATSLGPLVTHEQCIQGPLVDADIRHHILKSISGDVKLRMWPAHVQKEIEDALTRGANGMFRWVVCQLDSLRKCLRLDALRKALNTLPKTLDDTYERILSNLDQEYKEDSIKVLQWLCFSVRPMRLDEIVEVLAIGSDSDSRFSPDQRLLDPYDILKICSSLVSVTTAAEDAKSTDTTNSQELRLAHLSVKEYLISDRLKRTSMHDYHITPASANVSIAKSCLRYLLYFESPTMLTAKVNLEFPLLDYAAQCWPIHYRRITAEAAREAVDILGFELVKKESVVVNWQRIFDRTRHGLDNVVVYRPIVMISRVGVSGVLKMTLNRGTDAHFEDGIYGEALLGATSNGHLDTATLLMEKKTNFNFNIKDNELIRNSLARASFWGPEEMVRMLLENGVKVNGRCGELESPLVGASSFGRENVVRLLLEKGADIKTGDGGCCTSLVVASMDGSEEVVKLLLDHGADVNTKGGRALRRAAENCRTGVMRLLLKNKADVRLVLHDADKALQGVSMEDHEAVIQVLLKELGPSPAEKKPSLRP